MKTPMDPRRWVRCPDCGKRGYFEKRVAKIIDRRLHDSRMSVYRCPYNDELWHVGMLPKQVIAGEISRSDIYLTRPR